MYFPSPYVNESFYSIVCRYHVHSNNIMISQTLNELFENPGKVLHIEFATEVEKVLKKAGVINYLSVDEVINNHTNFYYYKKFLSEKESIAFFQSIRSGTGIDQITQLGLISGNIKLKSELFYCPLCAKEQIETVGEAWWNRLHQLQGVNICSTHYVCLHKVVLTGRKKLLPLSVHINKKEIDEIKYVSKDSMHVKIAKEIEWLVLNHGKTSYFSLHQQYKERLKAKGLFSYEGEVFRTRKISKLFVDFYSNGFLEMFNSVVKTENSRNWIANLINKKRTHPLRHVLFIVFLTESLEEFFQRGFIYLPFGQGPWKCLNPVATHKDSFCINNIELEQNADTRKLIGIFKCTCGFQYVRDEPNSIDKLNNNSFRVKYIKQFGKVWDKKLIEMVKQKQSLKYISNFLGVSPKKIKKEAIRLGLTVNWSNSNLYVKQGRKHNKRDYYEEFLSFYKSNPQTTRKEISENIPAVYRWLLKNDREWFEKHMPKVKSAGYRNRVDWKKRDELLLEKVKQVLKNWDNDKKRPVRITEAAIAREVLNRNYLFGSYRMYYPKTSAFVESIVEKPGTYYKRCIDKLVMQHKSKKFTSLNELAKFTRLSFNNIYSIRDYIHEKLNV